MVTSQLDAVLKDLEPFFKCKLEPDQNNSCLIKMANGLRIQLELDRQGENLMVGIRLGVIPPGRYRELIFQEALKANHLFLPSSGVFGYSKKSSHLILFMFMSLKDINQDKLVAALTPFLLKAQNWANAITKGDVPKASESEANSKHSSSSGLFGLMH